MFERHAFAALSELLTEFPAVAILGPRQVGKTTLALALALAEKLERTIYIDLESAVDRAKLGDPALFFRAHKNKVVILGEIQRAPDLFAQLRGVIDQRHRAGKRAGQFLLLGSATGALLKQSAESLAGRIAYLELPGLTAAEVAADDNERLWIRGGFPDAFLAKSDAVSLRWRRQFIDTYLERDIPQLGPRIPAETLRRFWTMLAHDQGQLLNAAKLAASLEMSGQSVARYLDLLSDLMLVRRLRPWAVNEGNRLVRSPKIYVRDSGFVHALLGLERMDDVIGHPVVGGSWEGWIVENIVAVAPPGTQAYFYRSTAGAEVDLILEVSRRERWAIEVKRSSAPALTKGFHTAADDVKATRRFLVYPGTDSFPMTNNVRAIGLLELQMLLIAVQTS